MVRIPIEAASALPGESKAGHLRQESVPHSHSFILLSDRDSPYPFTAEELSRFEKYRRLIHTTIHP